MDAAPPRAVLCCMKFSDCIASSNPCFPLGVSLVGLVDCRVALYANPPPGQPLPPPLCPQSPSTNISGSMLTLKPHHTAPLAARKSLLKSLLRRSSGSDVHRQRSGVARWDNSHLTAVYQVAAFPTHRVYSRQARSLLYYPKSSG